MVKNQTISLEKEMVEIIEDRAFWRKALYLTILAGRESVWAAIGTNGIPWLTNLGFSESRAASFTFVSGFSAIVLVKKYLRIL